MLCIVSAVTATAFSHRAHIRFRTPTALGPQESYRTSKIYSPILSVKQRGDVIFHPGTVIILVLSGSLPRLAGRSEFCAERLCSLLDTPVFFPLFCCHSVSPGQVRQRESPKERAQTSQATVGYPLGLMETGHLSQR